MPVLLEVLLHYKYVFILFFWLNSRNKEERCGTTKAKSIHLYKNVGIKRLKVFMEFSFFWN